MNGPKIATALFIAACHVFATHTVSLANDQKGSSLREQILSDNYSVAKGVLDENRRKKDTRLVCLSLSNASLLIKKLAAEALKEIGDKSSVSCLIEALENNQVVYTGGTETQILQQQLN